MEIYQLQPCNSQTNSPKLKPLKSKSALITQNVFISLGLDGLEDFNAALAITDKLVVLSNQECKILDDLPPEKRPLVAALTLKLRLLHAQIENCRSEIDNLGQSGESLEKMVVKKLQAGKELATKVDKLRESFPKSLDFDAQFPYLVEFLST